MADVRLAVLVSGSGTILEAMLADGLAVAVVVADRPCRGLDVASAAGVSTALVARSEFGGFSPTFDRVAYTHALVTTLEHFEIDLIAMAGFGTVTDALVYDRYPNRVLNTHPSLLPAFKGWHAVRDALAAGASTTGCTVHLATAELDEGPILAQREVPIEDGDDEERLQERIKSVERSLYPMVVRAALNKLAAGEPLESVRV